MSDPAEIDSGSQVSWPPGASSWEAEAYRTSAVAAEIHELLTEWRNTCAQMGMRWQDGDAAAFVAAAIGHRVAPPNLVFVATEVPNPLAVLAHAVWDDRVAPGGYVCSECGMPCESEPCEHMTRVTPPAEGAS